MDVQLPTRRYTRDSNRYGPWPAFVPAVQPRGYVGEAVYPRWRGEDLQFNIFPLFTIDAAAGPAVVWAYGVTHDERGLASTVHVERGGFADAEFECFGQAYDLSSDGERVAFVRGTTAYVSALAGYAVVVAEFPGLSTRDVMGVGVTFSMNGKWLVAWGYGTAPGGAKTCTAFVRGPSGVARSLALSSPATLVRISDDGRKLVSHDERSGRYPELIGAASGITYTAFGNVWERRDPLFIEFSGDGELVAVGSSFDLRLYDARSPVEILLETPVGRAIPLDLVESIRNFY